MRELKGEREDPLLMGTTYMLIFGDGLFLTLRKPFDWVKGGNMRKSHRRKRPTARKGGKRSGSRNSPKKS